MRKVFFVLIFFNPLFYLECSMCVSMGRLIRQFWKPTYQLKPNLIWVVCLVCKSTFAKNYWLTSDQSSVVIDTLFCKQFICRSGGVVQWTSHPPKKQKIRVRFPTGFKVFMENISILLCILDLIMHCLCVKMRNKPWRRGAVDIASTSGMRRPRFESHQGIRF
jgi:hypothetical protein